jgi:glyoxylase-like metal-dependent hydrolase (beta-lactamase superfamily II)
MGSVVGEWGGGKVWRVTSGVFPSNAYFCETGLPEGGLLIDPGLDGHSIDAQLQEQGLRPHQVFCTHGHFDHAGSASYFQEKYGCPVFMHEGDARTLKASNFLLMAFKIPVKIGLPEVTFVDDRFSIEVNDRVLRFLPTPGHTPGSCIIELGDAWFTGDTLYSQGVGLSKLPGENRELLRSSILGLWDRLTVGRTIYPGHGDISDGATLRRENLTLLKFLGLLETSGKTR